jgi:steroid delta-isomerase-like uncharacterized protein
MRSCHQEISEKSTNRGNASVAKNLMEFAMEYSAAWAAHDPDAIAAMHTEDSVFELHDVSAPAAGRAAVRDLIAALVTAVPDLRFEHKRAHFGDGHFVSEYVMKGTAEGKAFAIAGADVVTMRDGLVARKDTYLDWLAYERQVGIDPLATFKALGR